MASPHGQQKMSRGGEGPDFIGVGTQRSGTTWLAYVLEQHPQVLIRRKEVNFFVRHFHRGFDWYHEWFKDREGRKAGEITPNYIYSPRPDAARKRFYPRWFPQEEILFWRRRPSARDEIAAHYPQAKVFAIFRNPVERAWSHYWMWRERKERIGKGAKVVSFRTMFLDDGRWIQTQGFYARHLEGWLKLFPRMGVFLYDDLKSDPLGLARSLYRLIEVDDSFEPECRRQINRKLDYPSMPEEDRELAAETYRLDNRRFSELTGRDVSHWAG
jgi:hypothetical protein